MGRQVQQQTFNKIVLECMNDFELTREEAIQEAIDQLKKAGIKDFSNISTTPPPSNLGESHDFDTNHLNRERNLLSSSVEALQGAIDLDNLDEMLQSVTDLVALSSSHYSEIPVILLSKTLSHSKGRSMELKVTICELITKICEKDDADRSRFTTSSDSDIHTSLKQSLSDIANELNDGTAADEYLKQTHAILRCIAALQHRNERMKRLMASSDSPQHLLSIYREAGQFALQSDLHCEVFIITCVVIGQWLAQNDNDIDARIKVFENFARARILAGEHAVTDSGLRPLPSNEENLIISTCSFSKKYDQSPEEMKDGAFLKRRKRYARECLLIAKASAQSDDMCNVLFKEGMVNICVGHLRQYMNDEIFVSICITTLSKLAQRDECKSSIFSDGMPFVTQAARPLFKKCERVATGYLWLVARLCLRRPDIAREAGRSGTTDDVVDIMREYADEVGVANAGCHALRNVCSRDEGARKKVREGSAETVLREVMKKWGKRCDIAYYALQELDVLRDEEMRWDSRYGKRPSAMSNCVSNDQPTRMN